VLVQTKEVTVVQAADITRIFGSDVSVSAAGNGLNVDLPSLQCRIKRGAEYAAAYGPLVK